MFATVLDLFATGRRPALRPLAVALMLALLAGGSLLAPPPSLAQEATDTVAPAPPAAEQPPAAGDESEVGGEPVAPAPPVERRTIRKDARVVIGSSLTVEEDERVDDAVVIGGSLDVDGEVEGDAAAIGGSVRVNGPVGGEVVAVGGAITLGPHANVGGDVTSVGGSVEVDPAAVVGGKINEVPFGSGLRLGLGGHPRWWRNWDRHERSWWDWEFSPFSGIFKFVIGLMCLAILVLLACVVLFLAPAPVERIGQRAAADPLRSGLVGLLSQVLFIPILVTTVLLLVISIIGIPLLLLVPFVLLALVVVGFLGYTAVALRLGRWLEGRFGWHLPSPYVAMILGIAGIQAWSLLSDLLGAFGGPLRFFAWMVGVFGFLAWYLACTVGFGAALLARFGSTQGWRRGEPALPPPAAPAPPPAVDSGAPPATASGEEAGIP